MIDNSASFKDKGLQSFFTQFFCSPTSADTGSNHDRIVCDLFLRINVVIRHVLNIAVLSLRPDFFLRFMKPFRTKTSIFDSNTIIMYINSIVLRCIASFMVLFMIMQAPAIGAEVSVIEEESTEEKIEERREVVRQQHLIRIKPSPETKDSDYNNGESDIYIYPKHTPQVDHKVRIHLWNMQLLH